MMDLIVDPEEKKHFKKFLNSFIDSADQESQEEKFHVNTLTNSGLKMKSYSTLMWKTTWKSKEAIGIRFKLMRETDFNEIQNSQFKNYFKECLQYIEKRAFSLVSNISLAFRNLENHIEQNKPIQIENDCVALKEELDELSWIYVLLTNTMLNGEIMHESSLMKETTNLKFVILNIAEHTAFFSKKKNNDLEISFTDSFPDRIKTYTKPVLLLVYSFIMLFNEMTQNASIEINCESENVIQQNHIITLRFKVRMNRPSLDSLRSDILDGDVHSSGVEEMTKFLINSISKCFVALGANFDVQKGEESKGSFKVSLGVTD